MKREIGDYDTEIVQIICRKNNGSWTQEELDVLTKALGEGQSAEDIWRSGKLKGRELGSI
jgi:hypothetical protein